MFHTLLNSRCREDFRIENSRATRRLRLASNHQFSWLFQKFMTSLLVWPILKVSQRNFIYQYFITQPANMENPPSARAQRRSDVSPTHNLGKRNFGLDGPRPIGSQLGVYCSSGADINVQRQCTPARSHSTPTQFSRNGTFLHQLTRTLGAVNVTRDAVITGNRYDL